MNIVCEGIFDNIDYKTETTYNNINNYKVPQNINRKTSSNSNHNPSNDNAENNTNKEQPKKMMIIKNNEPNIKLGCQNDEEQEKESKEEKVLKAYSEMLQKRKNK